MEDYFTIGQIINTQGLKGEVRVYPLTDFPERFRDLKEVFLDLPTGLKKVGVEKAAYHKQFVLLKLEGYNSCDEAEKLRTIYLKVAPEEAVKLPEGHYFLRDIVGLQVFTVEGECWGKVVDILQTAANDVYVVKKGEKEILLPAIKEVVKEINLAEKKMLIQPLEGLC